MALHVRMARLADVPMVIELVERMRARYEVYQPVFWRRAARRVAKSRLYFSFQILNPRTTVLVCERHGLILGCLLALWTPAPPVFDPGGPTITVDDFCMANEADWPAVGGALIDHLRAIGRQRGWYQLVVINAAADLPKTRFLRSIDLSVASTWWVGTF